MSRALTLSHLIATDPAWATDAASPYAASYLHLGAISPDFAYMADAIGCGHDLALSRHLLVDAWPCCDRETEPENTARVRLGQLHHNSLRRVVMGPRT